VLRDDFTTQDVVVLLMANAGLVERAHDIAEEASSRLVHLLLDGLRVSAATEGAQAPSASATEEAMRRNSEHRLGATSSPPKGSKTPTCGQTTAQTSRHFTSEKAN
jgi:hypothetical protein